MVRYLIRTLLISGVVSGMMMIVGIHPVTGTNSCSNPQQCNDLGVGQGQNDCKNNKSYNHNNGAPPQGSEYYDDYTAGYDEGWTEAGCSGHSTEKK
jgi:hypothetical protein